MKIGFVGLGKMGKLLVRRLLDNSVEVVAYNRSTEPIEEIVKENLPTFFPCYSLKELVSKLESPRIIFVMVSQQAVDKVIFEQEGLLNYLTPGDIIIDGGNSYYKDSQRRFEKLKERSINFIDCGVSGGVEGTKNGWIFMVGGEEDSFKKAENVFKTLSVPNGYLYVGKTGMGHLVKTIHNGIEYGYLEALSEGTELLKNTPGIDLTKVLSLWNNGSIIESRILNWLNQAVKKDPSLSEISGVIGGGETGEWSLEYSESLKIKSPALESAVKVREESKKNPSFRGKVINSIRKEFGGHEVTGKSHI